VEWVHSATVSEISKALNMLAGTTPAVDQGSFGRKYIMNPYTTRFRCTAIVLIYSLFVQGLLAAPLSKLPANTIGFISWDMPVDRDELKVLAEWGTNTLDALPTDESEQPTIDAIKDSIELVRLFLMGSGAVGLVEMQTAGGQRELYGIARIELGNLTTRAMQILDRLFKSGDLPLERVTIAGKGYQRAKLGNGDEYLVFAAEDGLLTLVAGGENYEGMVSSLEKIDLNLADSKLLIASRKKVNLKGDPAVSGFLDVQRMITLIQSKVEEEGELPPDLDVILEETGLDAIKSVYLSFVADQKISKTRLFVATEGERVGLLKFWDHKPLEMTDIGLIPEDARFGMAFQFDWKMVHDELMRVLREVAPEAAAAVGSSMGMLQGMTNVSIPDQLFPALGDTWVIYDAPNAGGFMFTGLTLIADVRDKQVLREAFARYIEVLTPLLQQGYVTPKVMVTKEGGHKIEYLVFTGLPIPFAPAAAFVRDRVIVGLTPQVVRLGVQQISGKTPASTVLKHPDIEDTIKALPKNAQSFYYTDNRTTVRDLYWLTHLLLTAATSIAPSESSNPGLLPTLPEQLDQTRNAFAGWSADEDGLLYTAEGQLQMSMSGGSGVAVVAMMIAIMLPSLARARELAKRAVSRANLRGIGQGCYIYANDHKDQFPPSLDVLIDQGISSPKQFQSPRQSGDVCYVYIPQSMDSDVRNILAYEKVVGSEGTAVLYLDGHAEWVSLEQLEAELAQTGERLGRDLPVEYGE
jgi:hypothetical protein